MVGSLRSSRVKSKTALESVEYAFQLLKDDGPLKKDLEDFRDAARDNLEVYRQAADEVAKYNSLKASVSEEKEQLEIDRAAFEADRKKALDNLTQERNDLSASIASFKKERDLERLQLTAREKSLKNRESYTFNKESDLSQKERELKELSDQLTAREISVTDREARVKSASEAVKRAVSEL